MRDPAREEERNTSPRQVERIKTQGGVVHEVARVIKHHDDHHDAAQQVDRVYSFRVTRSARLIHFWPLSTRAPRFRLRPIRSCPWPIERNSIAKILIRPRPPPHSLLPNPTRHLDRLDNHPGATGRQPLVKG